MTPTDPTPPAPAALTASFEATLRRWLSEGKGHLLIPYGPALLDTIDATRAELAWEQRLRAFDTKTVPLPAGLMLEYERLDRLWQELVAERDAARAALERMERELESMTEAACAYERANADADVAGRALVGALERIICDAEEEVVAIGFIDADPPRCAVCERVLPEHDSTCVGFAANMASEALTATLTRWRTGEEPE